MADKKIDDLTNELLRWINSKDGKRRIKEGLKNSRIAVNELRKAIAIEREHIETTFNL